MTTTTNPMQTSTISEQLTGAFTALITPFRNGEIDERALRELVEFQIGSGIDGLVPCGTTGESATMTEQEHAFVIETVIDQAAGRVPVIAGTGTNNTRVTIERTRHALHAGATAALVVVPYYNKPTQEGLIAHYTAIAEAVDLPLVLYNVPGRTGITMSGATTIALSQIPTIAAIKEAAGNLDLVTEIVNETRDDFVVLSGDDSLTLPMISVGARGVISVLSNILPAEVTELTRLANAGQFAEARMRASAALRCDARHVHRQQPDRGQDCCRAARSLLERGSPAADPLEREPVPHGRAGGRALDAGGEPGNGGGLAEWSEVVWSI